MTNLDVQPIPSPADPYEIAQITYTIAKYLPIPLAIIALISFLIHDPIRGYISAGAILPSLLALVILKYRSPKYAIIYLTLLVTILNTMVCMTGMGIHDIAIVVFPVVILFSSLVLDFKNVMAVFAFVFLAVCVITLGEYWQWYSPAAPFPGKLGDSSIVSTICVVTVFITYLISENIISATVQTERELIRRMTIEKELKENVDAKTDLLKEVHHRVKNNLAFTSSLIDIESMGTRPNAQRLQSKIISIARANDPLFQSEQYETVDIKIYLEELITKAYKISDVTFSITNLALPVRWAVPIGVVVHEIVLIIRKHRDRAVEVNFQKIESKYQLEIKSDNMSAKQALEKMPMEKSMIEIMLRELNGLMSIDKGVFHIIF